MAHVPHLYLPRPWSDGDIPLDDAHRHHLQRVLRRSAGDPVAYTDGAGTHGEGKLAEGAVLRGAERSISPPAPVTVAVAPPASRERLRFCVEKLAELGVPEILWLDARFGEGRPPRPDKSHAWAVAALEQSQGAWITRVGSQPVPPGDLPRPVLVADPTGDPLGPAPGPVTVAVGPEGGWDLEELPTDVRLVSLGERVLRVETAAIAAAVRLLT